MMSGFEKILRFCALPLAVFLAVVAIWWVWATYPNDETFFLSRILPFYGLYLTMTAVSLRVLSGEIRQFMLVTTIVSGLFILEIFLRVFLGFRIF